MTEQGADQAIASTRRWLERIVIGLSLCPFAAAPFNKNRILYVVDDADTLDAIYEAFLETLYTLFTSDPQDNETALLILPRGLTAFDDYLEALGLVEDAITEAGLDGMVQVASFHPEYRFADAPADDPANYTNRSPYPMFHLIREDGLTAALESLPHPERIPQENIERLRALGTARIKALLEGD